MDDLISRSELISQLEGFKLSLGDVILGCVVDRVIERVKEQQPERLPAVAIYPDHILFIHPNGAKEEVKL